MRVSLRNPGWLLSATLLVGCAGSGKSPDKPELPRSVAPGWNQQSVVETPPPPGLPPTANPPRCWLATYSGPGTAAVRVCGYKTEGPAFDAAQRFPSAANTVKFQQKQWFVLVQWSGTSQTDATALVRGIQHALPQQ